MSTPCFSALLMSNRASSSLKVTSCGADTDVESPEAGSASTQIEIYDLDAATTWLVYDHLRLVE